jgi:membrane protein DedA with SNARE-associated domain
VAASHGDLQPAVALAAIVTASIIGGVVQYGLLRSVARPALLRLLGRLGSAEGMDHQTERLRRGGARSVAIARSTPGVRIVSIAASSLAGIPARAFIAGLSIGNSVFMAAHFGLGYVLGEPVVRAVGGLLGPLSVGFVILAVIGGIAWFLIRSRHGKVADPLTSVANWADACCPACLAFAVVDPQG